MTMNDPYKILNISPSATDEEVKKAYRDMAKKYHPDRYADSPLAETASEKMKQINEAYEQINEERGKKKKSSSSSSRRSSSAYGYGGYNAYGGSRQTRFPNIRALIQSGRYREAEDMLNSVTSTERDAEWYYLMGVTSYRSGSLERAYNYFETACELDPYNIEYRSFFDSVKNQRSGNRAGYAYRGTDSNLQDCCCDFACCLCCESLCNGCGY